MKRVLATLAVLALITMARSAFPRTAMAGDPEITKFAQVCCGSWCTPGDYCDGTGDYSCCK
jgi:hypothetical protein